MSRSIDPGLRSSKRHGFTLIELVLSLAIFSVLVVGMGSAMLIAARAMPDPTSPITVRQDGQRAIDELKTELTFAKTVTTATSTEIDFIVERAGTDTTIRYVWSGTSGDPLQRQVNGGTLITVVDAVDVFALEYATKPMTGLTPPLVEGPEILLDSRPTAGALGNFNVNDDNWIGQYFQPTLAADAVSWRVTRVLVKATFHGPTDGETLVQLRTPDGSNKPTITVLEQVTMFESVLTAAYTWQEFNYATVTGMAPGSGLCLVLEWVQSNNSAVIAFDYGGIGRLTASDPDEDEEGDTDWNFDSDKSMLFYAYGKATIPDPAWVLPNELVSVAITAKPTGTTGGPVTATTITLNKPEMSP